MAQTSNPAGSPRVIDRTPKPPKTVRSDVEQLRDPKHSEADFMRDLDKATERKPAAS